MNRLLFLALTVTTLAAVQTPVSGQIKAGVSRRDITPPVGMEIQHYYRESVGVHDPLFARCFYLEDAEGHAVALVGLDLIFADFQACDQIRREVREATGVENTLLAFSHSHSSMALGARGRPTSESDKGSKWNDATIDAILFVVKDAKEKAEHVSLRAGRASAQVGFNRRLVNNETDHVYMGVNRDGPVVPWVNVLIAASQKTGKPIGVLYEHAAHPVLVPDKSKLTSADFPGAAAKRIRATLGEDVVAVFGQGCCGNINGFPLRSTHEKADEAGHKLGDAVLKAIKQSEPLTSKRLRVKSTQTMLPSRPLPSEDEWKLMSDASQDDRRRMGQLNKIRQLMKEGKLPPPRRFDAYSISLGREWCLVTMPHEMFCQYELWVDKHAPFKHSMTLAYTNGYQGYIAVDDALKLEAKGGYEAGSLPNWSGQVWTEHFGPPAVGCEVIIKDALRSIWPQDATIVQPAQDAPQPLSPQESAAKVRLPDGFRLELVASEPLIQDPSGMTIDEKGRMFVCELHGYNVEGSLDVEKLNKTGELDKKVRRLRWELMGGRIAERAKELQYGVVKMLADTNGDGIMDQANIWADDLPPCYGLVPARGGMIVCCAPDIIFLADRDGDGEVDVRETLFTGFNVEVLERGINNPTWGIDNWIYIGSGHHAGTITGPNLAIPVKLGNTDFRIRADGSAIEPVSGQVGTFGLALNDWGDRFPCSGGQPAVYALPLPYKSLARNPHVASPRTNFSAANHNRGFRISAPHPWRIRRGQDPEWIKFYGARETNSNYFSGGCGGQFYQADQFPRKYRGNFFYCEPSLNMVHRCVVTRDGVGYKASRAPEEEDSEFLSSTDQWFRPMNLRVGPDDSFYVVDMYREIIEDYSAIPRFLQQQYGVGKSGQHGRIWRLRHGEDRTRKIEDVTGRSAVELAKSVADPNIWWRTTAQRLLIERHKHHLTSRNSDGKDAEEALREIVRDGSNSTGRIHALHTLHGLSSLTTADIVTALGDHDFAVRAHALRLAGPRAKTDPAVLSKLVTMTDDEDPRVRLQLALALGETPSNSATKALAHLATRYGDERWMDAAILSSAMGRSSSILLGLMSNAETANRHRALIARLATTPRRSSRWATNLASLKVHDRSRKRRPIKLP